MTAILYVGHCSNWEIFTFGEERKQPFSFKLLRLYPPERLHFWSTCPSRELTEGRQRISIPFNTFWLEFRTRDQIMLLSSYGFGENPRNGEGRTFRMGVKEITFTRTPPTV